MLLPLLPLATPLGNVIKLQLPVGPASKFLGGFLLTFYDFLLHHSYSCYTGSYAPDNLCFKDRYSLTAGYRHTYQPVLYTLYTMVSVIIPGPFPGPRDLNGLEAL